MKEYIIITGATSGIGYEMAKQLAKQKHNLVLVSRNEKKMATMLSEFKTEHEIEVEYFIKDLSNVSEALDFYKEVKNKRYYIKALINNAGVGMYGNFIETSLEEELKMIELNVSSLVVLTKLFAQDMVKQRSGKIMNVASLLSFIPFPYYSVYSATKTFVLSFTETVAAEMEGTGVVITALCPGTVDTAFHSKEMWKTNAMSANKPVSAESVAKEGVKLLLHGKGKKIVGFNNWFISNLPRFTPDSIMMKIKKNLASLKKNS